MPRGIYKRKLQLKVLFTCQNCGVTKYMLPRLAKKRKFCSHECSHFGKNNHNFGKRPSTGTREKISKGNSGERNGNWIEKVSITCQACGKIMYVTPRVAKIKKYCSDKCYFRSLKITKRVLSEEHKKRISENHGDISGKKNGMYGKTKDKNPIYGKKQTEESKEKNRQAHLGKMTGKDNPAWKEKKPFICQYCGKIKYAPPSVAKTRKFCSFKCRCSAGHTEEAIKKIKKARLRQIIPTRDTSIEIKIQNILIKNNIKFEKHKAILGQPDVFITPNICIFADGDYWHNTPKSIKRDKYVNNELKEQGYIILRFWEHEINNDIDKCFVQINNIIAQ